MLYDLSLSLKGSLECLITFACQVNKMIALEKKQDALKKFSGEIRVWGQKEATMLDGFVWKFTECHFTIEVPKHAIIKSAPTQTTHLPSRIETIMVRTRRCPATMAEVRSRGREEHTMSESAQEHDKDGRTISPLPDGFLHLTVPFQIGWNARGRRREYKRQGGRKFSQ